MCQGTDFSECVLLVLQILRAGEDEGGAGVLWPPGRCARARHRSYTWSGGKPQIQNSSFVACEYVNFACVLFWGGARRSSRYFLQSTGDCRSVSTTPCRVTPPLDTRGPAPAASTIPPFSAWPCHTPVGTTDRRHQAIGVITRQLSQWMHLVRGLLKEYQ